MRDCPGSIRPPPSGCTESLPCECPAFGAQHFRMPKRAATSPMQDKVIGARPPQDPTSLGSDNVGPRLQRDVADRRLKKERKPKPRGMPHRAAPAVPGL